ncbi:CRISPR-associated endonuclease Cas2 [Desulfoplanes sp. PS50]
MDPIFRKEYLICYDIKDNKIRTKVFQELEKTGMKNVQQSVFWGFLSMAELNAVRRFTDSIIKKGDKALVTRTNFNGHGCSFLFGYCDEEFQDWKEHHVI